MTNQDIVNCPVCGQAGPQGICERCGWEVRALIGEPSKEYLKELEGARRRWKEMGTVERSPPELDQCSLATEQKDNRERDRSHESIAVAVEEERLDRGVTYDKASVALEHETGKTRTTDVLLGAAIIVIALVLGMVALLPDSKRRGEEYAELIAGQVAAERVSAAQSLESFPAVFVQGGTFQMGSLSGRKHDERPVRSVTVSSFHMARKETTVAQFRKFVDATGYRTTAETSGGGWVWTGRDLERRVDATWRNPNIPQTDMHPVVLISWYDAVAYANWLSERHGLNSPYTIRGAMVTWTQNADSWRLPTEAEWEYAARGGSRSRGYAYAGSNNATLVAW